MSVRSKEQSQSKQKSLLDFLEFEWKREKSKRKQSGVTGDRCS